MTNTKLDLNSKEVLDLVRAAKSGDTKAFSQLVVLLTPVVRAQTKRIFVTNDLEGDDLFQEGMFGVIEAIRKFDGSRGASFLTYANLCIRSKLLSATGGGAEENAPERDVENVSSNNGQFAYFELLDKLKQWALNITKTIRHISYERSLPSSKIEIAEARLVEDLNDENSLISEEYFFTDSVSESAFMDQSESQELAETDFFSKLNVLLGQKKMQTKYTALNINERLTQEQRKVLERVFDLITQEFNPDLAERFVNTISAKF